MATNRILGSPLVVNIPDFRLRALDENNRVAFDMRVVGMIRHFLAATGAPVRRRNVDAAAFVAFQSVRATMLASLLERPPGLGESDLVEEITDLVLRYLVDAPAASASRGAHSAIATSMPRHRL